MRTKLFAAVCLGCVTLTVSGCWDANYLINKRIVNGIALDAADNNRILGTVRAIALKSKGGGQFDVKDEVIHTTEDSVTKIGYRIDAMLPGTIEASKTHVVIIGDELAKRGIMTPLEFFCRSQKGYMKSNVIISQGPASDIIKSELSDNSPIAFDIKQMIRGSERKSLIPKQTIFSLWTHFGETGEDNLLPIIRKNEEKKLTIDSIALMKGETFTGVTLQSDESVLLMLLKDKLDKLAFMSVPLELSRESGGGGEKKRDSVSVEIRKMKRDFNVYVEQESGQIGCDIRIDLYGEIINNPEGLGKEIDRPAINEQLSAALNKQAEAIVQKLQKANCDAFGIGRELKAHYHGIWESTEWNQAYKEAHIQPEVHMHITSTGALK